MVVVIQKDVERAQDGDGGGLPTEATRVEAMVFSARQHAERAICYRKSVRLSVCLSVRPSVCHTGGSVKNG